MPLTNEQRRTVRAIRDRLAGLEAKQAATEQRMLMLIAAGAARITADEREKTLGWRMTQPPTFGRLTLPPRKGTR